LGFLFCALFRCPVFCGPCPEMVVVANFSVLDGILEVDEVEDSWEVLRRELPSVVEDGTGSSIDAILRCLAVCC